MNAGRVVLVGAALSLLACTTSSSDSDAAPPTRVEWFVGLGTGAQPEQLDVQRDVVAAFNDAHDDIVLDLEVFDNELAFDELRDRLAAGEGPDLIGPVGIRGSAEFDGEFLDLRPYLDEGVLAAYDDEQLAIWKDGDAVTALPFGVFPSMLFVNEELFSRAGLPLPPTSFGVPYDGALWDIDALTSLATKLTVDADGRSADDPAFDASRIVQWGFHHQFLEDARAHGAFFGAGSMTDAAGDATIPEPWLAEWRWYHEAMWSRHISPTGPETESAVLRETNAFATGRVAMAFTHLWYVPSLVTEDGAPLTFWNLAVPPAHDGQHTAKVHADTFRVLASTDVPEAAATVLAYLHDDAAADLLGVYGSFPARADLRAPFLDDLRARFGDDIAWDVIDETLTRPDVPSHEAGLPEAVRSQALLDAFHDALRNDPDLDVAAAAEGLERDLQAVFTGG
mgnify:CR=1 FL=1